MKRRFKKSTIMPVVLLIYLAVMSYIGWPNYVSGKFSPLFYFGVIGITLFVIFLLHIFLKKKEKQQAARKQSHPTD